MNTMPILLVTALLVAPVGCAPKEGRSKGDACKVTADCEDDLFCEGNTCQAPASCGDGQCNGDETPATCCLDCVCPSGQCNSITKACTVSNPTTSKMTWNVTNNCYSGGPVQYRFFDRITKAPITNVATLLPGASASASVTCRNGTGVCFGGRDTKDGSYYGMDVDGGQECVGCCQTCAAKSVTFGPLVCQ